MNRAVTVAAIIVLAVCAGCARQVVRAPQGAVHHVVLVWLADRGDRDKRRAVVEASRSLADIPGVLAVEVGTVLPSGRGIVDDSFDVGIHMSFRSERDMQAYVGHPDHVDTVKRVIAPLAERITVYDFRE